MEIKKQLIIGLPETGKTTFLAALWHVVESGEVPGSLVVSEVHGSREHLNRIRKEWLNCQELDRTNISSEKMVSFRLRDPQTATIVELDLPDISGETFRLQWESRQWTSEFDKLAAQSSGTLLFVHPRTVIEPGKIDSTVELLTGVLEEPESHQQSSPIEIQPWSPSDTPTQVKLVEILQFLLSRPFQGRTLPVVVLISAWDLIPTQKSPGEWLRERLPLLYQFLKANAETIPSSVFGISAQGAELSKADELQRHVEASDRIMVTTPENSKTHDITAPIRWLLEH